MRNILKKILIIIIPFFLISFSYTFIQPVFADPENMIPKWIKNNAGWWATDQIDDNSFVQGIQYLINQEIMAIASTSTGTGSGPNEIPLWIKSNAGWWAEGLISDNDFVQGIQYLIENGIITISSSVESLELSMPTIPKDVESPFSWEQLVNDAKHAWDGSIMLREMNVEEGLHFGIRYDAVSDKVIPMLDVTLLDSAIWMYLITGDEYYLKEASSIADDIEKYRINDKNIMSASVIFEPQKYSTTNRYSLIDISKLALLNPSYSYLVEKMGDAMIKYEINPKTNLFYESVSLNGKPDTKEMYFPWGGDVGIEALLRAYEATSNEKYLEQAKKTILSYWDTRNSATNLLPSSIHPETKDVTREFMQQYGAGSFLKILLHYYYLTYDETIYRIIEDYSEAVSTYLWDGYTWNYRTNYDGSVIADVVEANFPKLDDALFLIYDLDNSQFHDIYQKAKSDYDNSFQNELIIVNDLVTHAVRDDGAKYSSESRLSYAFTIVQNPAFRLYLETGDKTYLDKMEVFYDAIIEHHKRDYGYILGIDAYTLEDDIFHPEIYSQMTGYIGNKIFSTIIPSSNVKITWTVIGDTELYSPFLTTFYDAGWFNAVDFDFKNKKIDLDIVTGEGYIVFPGKIQSALIDGNNYANFSDNVLDTISGIHSYSVKLS